MSRDRPWRMTCTHTRPPAHTDRSDYRTGGGEPAALAAKCGSQAHTVQACWNTERANATAPP